MKQLTVTFIALFSMFSFAQIEFQPGYYIDKNSNKIEGLIENLDWSEPPMEFSFKKTTDDEVKTLSIDFVTELKIEGTEHYYKNLLIGEHFLYSTLGEKISYSSDTFLSKVIIDGAAKLYISEANKEDLFIIQIKDNPPVILNYKKYVLDDGKVRERKDFQNQLFDASTCKEEATNISYYLNLKYRLSDISEVIFKFNACSDAIAEDYRKNKTKGVFNFFVKGNALFNNFQTAGFGIAENIPNDTDNFAEFPIDNQISFGLGIEIEYMLPFKSRRWSIFSNPMFQYISETSSTRTDQLFLSFSDSNTCTYTVGLSYLELPIAVRYVFVQSADINVYFNVEIGTNLILSDSSNLDFVDAEVVAEDRIDTSTRNGFFRLGAGVRLNSKFDVFLNYYASKFITSTDTKQQNDLSSSIGLGASYKLF